MWRDDVAESVLLTFQPFNPLESAGAMLHREVLPVHNAGHNGSPSKVYNFICCAVCCFGVNGGA